MNCDESESDPDGSTKLEGLRKRVAELEAEVEHHAVGERLLSALLDRLHHGVYRMSLPRGEYEYFSPGAEEVFGYTAAEFLANPLLIREILHPDDEAYFREMWGNLLEGIIDPVYEYRVIDPSGAERWILQTNSGVVDDRGRIVAIEGCCSEVTDRKLVEQALRDSEERAASLVKASPMGIFTYRVDDDDRLIFVDSNPAADAILGVDCRQYRGMTLEEAFPPLAGTEIPVAYRRAALEGIPWQSEQIDYEDEDIEGAYEVHAFQTAPRRVAVLFLDITGIKRAEAESRRAQAQLRAAIEQTPAGVLIADAPDMTIRIANSAALAIRGNAEDPLLDISSESHPANWQVFRPDGVLCTAEELPLSRAILFGETVTNEEVIIRRGDGEDRWVLANASPVRDESGNIVAGVAVFADITERKELEEQRQRLQAQVLHAQKLESLGVLSGGIAHDFNNLLCGILGGADLALLDLDPGHPAHGNVETVKRSAHTATDLCRQLLAYSGKGRFVVEPLDLTAVIEEMSRLLTVSVSKSVTLRFELAESLPATELDASQLQQIVVNMVVNASEAIGDANGVVIVRTGEVDCDGAYLTSADLTEELSPGRHVFLEVSDTGCGMEAETVAKIFDPFFTTKFTGRGLGLAATQGIVRGHSGAICVYTEPGVGTTFKVFFPASSLPVASARPSPPTEAWRGTGRVLIVDDDEVVLHVSSRILERLGFSVVTAVDGLEGVLNFERHHEDLALVFLDMTMPRLSGAETFRRLRAIDPRVPVLLMSGYNEQEATSRFLGKGLAGFLQKPFSTVEVREKVRAVLGT